MIGSGRRRRFLISFQIGRVGAEAELQISGNWRKKPLNVQCGLELEKHNVQCSRCSMFSMFNVQYRPTLEKHNVRCSQCSIISMSNAGTSWKITMFNVQSSQCSQCSIFTAGPTGRSQCSMFSMLNVGPSCTDSRTPPNAIYQTHFDYFEAIPPMLF